MNITISEFSLAGFEQITPLLLRCFPEFWTERFAAGKRSFPYDLRLFSAKKNGQIIGCIGIHEYSFFFEEEILRCGGISDVAVDPDYRGMGIAKQMLSYAAEICRKNYPDVPMIPLYTDKPRVYRSSGWEIYSPVPVDNSTELPDLEEQHFLPEQLKLTVLAGEQPAETEQEKKALQILDIYRNGKWFPGKCERSVKTWWEILTAENHKFLADDSTYYLIRNGTLLETYSGKKTHPVNSCLPQQGGLDSNRIMLYFSEDCRLKEAAEKRVLIFPAADVF